MALTLKTELGSRKRAEVKESEAAHSALFLKRQADAKRS